MSKKLAPKDYIVRRINTRDDGLNQAYIWLVADLGTPDAMLFSVQSRQHTDGIPMGQDPEMVTLKVPYDTPFLIPAGTVLDALPGKRGRFDNGYCRVHQSRVLPAALEGPQPD
jgi:hypothetical protein